MFEAKKEDAMTRYEEAFAELRKAYPYHSNQETSIAIASIGLSEEVGEVCSIIKRYFRGDTKAEVDKKALKAELGDVLSYLVLLGSYFDISLTEIADYNIEKLTHRVETKTILGKGSDR